ncbi:MAG: site-specific integrase [Planctomycetaceae bacterium]
MPRICVVEPRKNARVRIGGRAYWLGPCPGGRITPSQVAEATRLWHEFLQAKDRSPPPAPRATVRATPAATPPTSAHHDAGCTVSQIGVRYHDHCLTYYRRPNGSVTSSVHGVEMALRALFPFADTPATAFGPKSLKLVRDSLVAAGRPRVTCNRVVNTIRRMFGWAASEELVPGEVWQALRSVSALQKGRTPARELPPIEEVPEHVVDATLPLLSRVVAAMIQFQRWTGARPGEAVLLRPCDIDRSGPVWVYTPQFHKLDWRDDAMPRRVVIGKEGQRAIEPFLARRPDAYCFSPCEAEKDRAVARRAARQSPLTPSQRARKPKRNGNRRPRDRYDTASYRRAISRAVELANAARTKAGIEERLPNWAPNQLRHLRAGEVELRSGIEAANAILGHQNIRTTEIYARRKLQIAMAAALEHG